MEDGFREGRKGKGRKRRGIDEMANLADALLLFCLILFDFRDEMGKTSSSLVEPKTQNALLTPTPKRYSFCISRPRNKEKNKQTYMKRFH